jgi:hypothetical protein
LIHRFAILSDLAPYTEKYREHLAMVRDAIDNGEFTDTEVARARELVRQVHAKKKRKDFAPYQYREGLPTAFDEIIKDGKPEKQRTTFEAMVGSYWEKLGHGAETPLEYLTPVSPASKLIHMRSAIEDYEKTQVYGTESGFWQHPLRDFIFPFFSSLGKSMGVDRIPQSVKERRGLEEYFDILKYVKATKLERDAYNSKDYEAAKEFSTQRRETLFGINPYTYNFSDLYRSLPRRERDYFRDFSETKDMNDRARIYKTIPENEQAFYLARWKLQDAADMRTAVEKGLLTEEQELQATKVLNDFSNERKTEGMPTSKELWAEYLSTRLQGEDYGDWYRRTYLITKALKGRVLPGPDWIGFHPAVDLNDVKLKVVQNEGQNAYDYDIWPDQIRGAARRPYLEEAAQELKGTMSSSEAQSRINRLLAENNIQAQVSVVDIGGASEHTIDIRLREDRSREIMEMKRRGDLE